MGGGRVKTAEKRAADLAEETGPLHEEACERIIEQERMIMRLEKMIPADDEVTKAGYRIAEEEGQ